MLKKTLLIAITAIFLFAAKTGSISYPECKIGSDPINADGHTLQPGEEIFWPDGDYVVRGMRGRSGKIYGPCIVGRNTKDRKGNPVYFVKRFGRLALIGNCENDFTEATPLFAAVPQTTTTTTTVVSRPQPIPFEPFGIAINVWPLTTLTQKLELKRGYQSRDYHPQIIEEKRAGRLSPFQAACMDFQLNMFGFNGGTFTDQPFSIGNLINPNHPNFSPANTVFTIQVCNGRNWIEFSKPFLAQHQNLGYTVTYRPNTGHVPQRLHYPRTNILHSCRVEEIRRDDPNCSFDPNATMSELAHQVATPFNGTNLHFVVETR